MEKRYLNPAFPHFLHGGDYNPDQWQDRPDILAEDLRLLPLANCNEFSIGIFAWASLEPAEGQFDFAWLDRSLDGIYRAGGRVFLATPSGARPAWLAEKYPEVLRVDTRGKRRMFGYRHNHCPTSPIYREKVKRINSLLSERYAKHPAVIGWHISNEYGSEDCCCPLCQNAFREWVKARYKTLDAVNKAWANTVWSHTLSSWEQIAPPMQIGETLSPGLDLDWKRFVTDQTTDFMKTEIDAVREFDKVNPVTTNYMSFYERLDYRVMSKELDLISVDCYPTWRSDGNDLRTAAETAAVYDLCRSLQHKSWLLMESTPSNVNWHPFNKLKRPGQNMLASLQAVAHGADGVQYFQWRKCRGGCENWHGAVVDHVGTENTRVFREVSELGARLKALDAVVGTGTEAKAAILYDWQNRWAINKTDGFQKKDKKVMTTLFSHYEALWKRGVNVDIIGQEDDFNDYSLLIAPMLYMAGDALGKKLAAFVENGGTLLCTYMTGMTDENCLAHLGGFPGGILKDVFGIWNEEIDTLYPDEFNTVTWDGKEYKAVDYCEIIHPSTAETLASYSSDFYAGGAALTVNHYGKGKAYYLAFRDTGDVKDLLTDRLLKDCAITSDFDGALPTGVTAHSRTDGEKVFVFLQNFNNAPAEVETALSWVTADTAKPISGKIPLAPFETVVLEKKK